MTAFDWLSRMRSARSADSANVSSDPNAVERSWPRPCSATAAPCIQVWNAARVRVSKVRKISSSWTDGATWAFGNSSPSGSDGASLLPGVSST